MSLKNIQQKLQASVIISVYNNTNALKLVLNALKLQTVNDFEIIISEDAEHPEMATFCQNYNFTHPHQHLRQTDQGWRKNRALNRAIKNANGNYLIFIDGDCIPHSRFVEFHLKKSGPKHIVGGKRAKLNSELTEFFVQNINYPKKITKKLLATILQKDKKGTRYAEEGLFITPHSLFGFIPCIRKIRNITGSNMSFYKSAIQSINGFDEDYLLPAIGEDIDLVWRFKAANYKFVSVRNLAVQYHLYHKENYINQDVNFKIMEEKKSQNEYICKNGLVKY